MNELRKTRSKSSAVQIARVERVLEINTDNQIKTIEWLYLSSKGHRRLLFEMNKNQYNFHWLIP